MTDATLKNQKDEINALINEAGMRCTGRLANLFMNDSLLIPIKESTEKNINEYKSVLTRKKKVIAKGKCSCTGFYTQCGAWVAQCSLHRLLHSVQSMGRSTLIAQAFTLNAEHG